MKTNTFEHLESLCAGVGVVCERDGKKINLTVPNGSVSAECDGVRDALDTMRSDPTFSKLPILLRREAKSYPQPSPAMDVYVYKFETQAETVKTIEAESLNEAVAKFGSDYEIALAFKSNAIITNGKMQFGVTWNKKA